MIKEIKKIDEFEIFKLNDNPSIQIIDITSDGHKVILVDDFYSNPDLVRQYALDSQYTESDKIIHGAPIYRTEQRLDNSNVIEFVNTMIKTVYGDWNSVNSSPIMFNAYKKDSVRPAFHHIHVDGSLYANIVYLNKDEVHGGTAFWKHIDTDLSVCPTLHYQKLLDSDIEKLTEQLSEINEVSVQEFRKNVLFPIEQKQSFYDEETKGKWKMIEKVEMKYNRMILYPGSYFHSMVVSENDYADSWRICQASMFD